ncbi:putative cold-shock DNA-binding protein [Pontibacter ummariensis]|uniref:Cold-shock DNA-binding protein family n=1 Tax=Pontibacter ummariensis TaxID=1610492 RepID=A0A239HWB1_9BACT|nr:cold shock domain-containing protein [Pontibacter ummariensis]PRY10092.1 putative cold-shock DNA-binding protein [Pontibacter ummariensis]SNS85666.1 cold-shock DNA-binding protein family [Pontibacter ummariensis]
MGRSQETFSKKEKEKKKLKKRQEKQEKKEERREASAKGKGLEEMLAYVDDEGNITSTPPDPKKKKVIEQEDIQIGVSRQAAHDPADLIRKGTVNFFNASKGYGFIKDHQTQESIFVHQNNLSGIIKENDKVSFEVEKGPKGLNAVNVKVIE